ncbi:hypothetical protein [Falsibacillus pallidus]|uniref:Sporulation and spore germination protein n=1 Tax=Falsibacillus pallidus TaxID=493781 RepID=A0A370GDK5_9BACI|nr:hypothetical protein [Falsibacillus pallidus]RDI41296.1 hypothetical protein DFR59_109142 [Falsibacillus pallidus]
MKKSEWDDHRIEELFKAMPKIHDERSPHEIYEKIQQTQKASKRKLPAVFSFSAAAAAVVLIIVLILPVLTNEPLQLAGPHDQLKKQSFHGEEKNFKKQELRKDVPPSSNSDINSQDASRSAGISMLKAAEEPIKTTVSKEEEKDHYVLRFGLPSPDAIFVPITILVDKAKYSSWMDAFNATAEKIPEQDWGFDDFYPLQGELNYDEQKQKMVVKLDENNPYTTALSLESSIYLRVFQYDFEQMGIKDVEILNEAGKPMNFESFGPIDIINPDRFKTGYYSYTLPNGDNYLVPGEVIMPNAQKAFEMMKDSPSDLLQSIIPQGIDYSVEEKNSEIETIKFSSKMNLNSGDQAANLKMIEGMLLTAHQFGYKYIQFENITPEKWEGYDFSKLVETPISPNKKELP